MSQLKKGLVHKNPLPQRHKRLCKWSRKIRWLTEEDALIGLSRLKVPGSVYYHKACGSWHVTTKKN